MPVTVQVWDEVLPGSRTSAEAVTLPQSTATARDLIRSRVRQEVERYNQTQPELFRGLVQPEESEQTLNGFRLKARRPLVWETQVERACASFERNGFLLLVNGRQVESLDEIIELRPESQIEFVKLVPLVGG